MTSAVNVIIKVSVRAFLFSAVIGIISQKKLLNCIFQ